MIGYRNILLREFSLGPPSIVPLLCCVVLFTVSKSSQTQTPKDADRLGRPSWVTTPKKSPIASQREAAGTSDTRKARDLMFNTKSGKPLIPHVLGDLNATSPGGADQEQTRHPLPYSISDVVFVASVGDFQPYLSQDQSMVYTELSGTNVEVVRDQRKLLTDGSPATVLQRGGTLELADGKVVSAVPFGGDTPLRLHHRYLLFAKYHPEAKAFTVIKAWDLEGSQPKELDGYGHTIARTQANVPSFQSEKELKDYIRSR